MRSMPSTSRVTCSLSTSATVGGRLISAPVGSGPNGTITASRSHAGTGDQFPIRPEPWLHYPELPGYQTASRTSVQAKMGLTRRAHAVAVGIIREERDAREGNRRVSFPCAAEPYANASINPQTNERSYNSSV